MFPNTPLDVHVDIHTGEVWEDITAYRMEREPISITQGRSGEGSTADPSRCSLVLNNRDGRFSPHNPRGAYYGVIGRNTPLRVWVPGETYYDQPTPGLSPNELMTPGGAHLNVTDLDVRVEVSPETLAGRVSESPTGPYSLMDRMDSGARTWELGTNNQGNLQLRWSPDGVAVEEATSSETIPAYSGSRVALRATLQVDDGFGYHVVTFYTAPDMDSPWVKLGQAPGRDGVTSVASTTSDLALGNTSYSEGSAGRYYRAQVLNGIDGAAVADLDLRAASPGATSVTDGTGNLWTVDGGEITNREYRFSGEVAEWPITWDTSGTDVTASITASGLTRRLRQGHKPQPSALRRALTASSALAYWPLEEPEGATAAFSPLPGVHGLEFSGATFGQDDSLTGSLPLPTVTGDPIVHGLIPGGTGNGWTFNMLFKLDELPATRQWFAKVLVSSKDYKFVRMDVGATDFRFWAEDGDGVEVASFTVPWSSTSLPFTGEWNRLAIYTRGGGTSLAVAWQNAAGAWENYFANFTGDPGAITAFRLNWSADFEGMSFGHISAFDDGSASGLAASPYDNAMNGYPGESAGTRMFRLAREAEVPLTLTTSHQDTERVGGQRPAALLEALDAAAHVDGGLLYEDTEDMRLIYRSRASLYNQPVALSLDYAGGLGEVAPPLVPVGDDSQLRNDVTAQRDGGSAYRYVETDGPLSVDAVGVYDESITVNAYSDDQMPGIAGWRVHLGTVDESRYPAVHMRLHAAPHLIPQVLRFRLLDRLQVVNPPEWLPPEPIDQVVTGYTETLSMYEWHVELACQPFSPYKVGTVDDGTSGDPGSTVYGHVDTDGSVTTSAVDEVTTTLPVTVTSGPAWTTDPTDFPFDLMVGGEVMTATGADTGVSDEFDRTEAGGWGGAWAVPTAFASEFSVAGGAAKVAMSAAGTAIRHTEITPTTFGDPELVATISTTSLAVGGFAAGGVSARNTGTDCFTALLMAQPSGELSVRLYYVEIAANAKWLLASSVLPFTHAAGQKYRLRYALTGATHRAKAWEDGTAEPAAWQVEDTSATQISTGEVGAICWRSSMNLNSPMEFAYDSFAASEKAFSVVRGINGLTLPHSAGTDVRLATPCIVAL